MIFYQESNFKDGFTAGFIGSASGSAMGGGTQWNDIAKRTAIAATAGGIATELGGGKFANGARTAAFVHLFNAEGIGSTFSNRESSIKNIRMKKIEFSSDNKALSLLGDVASNIMPASFSITPGDTLYNRIDTVQDYNVYYRKTGIASVMQIHQTPIGERYQVINMSGSPQSGYNYTGNGVYRRRSNNFQTNFD